MRLGFRIKILLRDAIQVRGHVRLEVYLKCLKESCTCQNMSRSPCHFKSSTVSGVSSSMRSFDFKFAGFYDDAFRCKCHYDHPPKTPSIAWLLSNAQQFAPIFRDPDLHVLLPSRVRASGECRSFSWLRQLFVLWQRHVSPQLDEDRFHCEVSLPLVQAWQTRWVDLMTD